MACGGTRLRRLWRGGALLFLCGLLARGVYGQAEQDSGPAPGAGATGVTVHGVVKNAATGEPLSRVLVQVGGEAGPAALTDGQGHFELAVGALGPQTFQLTRPGFHEAVSTPASAATEVENTRGMTHNVFVTPGTPDLEFAMEPANAIQGRIDLSTGDSAQGIGVTLLRRSIEGGRAVWRMTANTRTNSDGAYRFGDLEDGVYAISTESARESEAIVALVDAAKKSPAEWNGYPATYYPDASSFAGAARLSLHMGETAQANLLLKLQPFHLVVAKVTSLNERREGLEFGAIVTDEQGHSLLYPTQFDAATQTVQAMLPDGTYSIRLTATRRPDSGVGVDRISAGSSALQGSLAFTVAGKPVTGLHIPVTPRIANPLQVSVAHSSNTAAQPNGPGVFVSVSPAGDSVLDGALVQQYAQGVAPGSIETSAVPPGSYWVHTTIAQPGLCEASFTAGGANLAREPLVIGPGGATSALALNLRDDCASVKLSLPPDLTVPPAGEEPFFTVYAIPDFDSTVDVVPVTVRPSSGGTVTLSNLTPGGYHVYTFAGPVELEYRNRQALGSLSRGGQAITLDPGATSTLQLEVPAS